MISLIDTILRIVPKTTFVHSHQNNFYDTQPHAGHTSPGNHLFRSVTFHFIKETTDFQQKTLTLRFNGLF